MIVNIEEVNSIKRKLTVELPAAEADQARLKHLDDYARNARLKGFRPGKAPKSMVAKVYADELRRKVLEELVAEAVPKALDEHKLEPVGAPLLEDVEYETGGPFKFTVSLELKPVFETPKWQGLELEKTRVDISEEMVDKRLDDLRLSLAAVKKITDDRPLGRGDLALISYQGYDGDKIIAKMKAAPFNVELNTDRLSPEFEAGLSGMRAGETKDIPIIMGDELEDPELAGKNIFLRTTVHEIKERELPALDDEMAKDLGLEGVETLEDLRSRLRRELTREAEGRADHRFNKDLTNALAGLVDIEAPTAMVDREVANKIETMRNSLGGGGRLRKLGLDLNISALREDLRPAAVNNVKAALVLDQIARDNNVEINEEDIARELAEMSEEYSQPVDVLREYYQSRNLMANLREGLKISKTIDLIKNQAIIKEVDKTADPADLTSETLLPEAAAQEIPAPEALAEESGAAGGEPNEG
ncbi:MAG: trigger factor [Candidatus Adiutrix sp.]|jgi:trigger factor|nr:trigger factor [Candidatus Adiutrix sp.]